MDGVDDTAGLEKIFLSVKETWEQHWKEFRVGLSILLGDRFDRETLRDLCFRLDIGYEDLPAEGNKNKARELVARFEREGRLDELVQECRNMLPKVPWATPVSIMDERWQRVDCREAARRYAAYIWRECGTMRVFGQPKPVSLEGIFTDVFLLDKPTAWQRFQVEELQKQYEVGEWSEHMAERKGGLEAFGQNQRLFILGKPGAGKTTFLKHIALQAVDGKIDKVPIFLSLKTLADLRQSLSDYIVSHFKSCLFPDPQPFVEWLLAAGHAIILFDGLDEVNQSDYQQQRIATEIEQFTRTYHKNQFAMTCRIAATEYNFNDFTYVEMADFTPEQVESFAAKWFVNHGAKLKMFLSELAKPESKGLRELARTPLLLALLCLAFDETLAFPQRRVEIYEEAIDALLKKWDSSRQIRRDEIYRDLSLGRKRQMLARIAAETFEKGIYFMPQRALERMIVEYLQHIPPGQPAEEIDGEAVLKAIEAQHGIFIERAKGIYSFAHLTFQEYFTAKHQVENAAQGTLDRLIRQYMTDARWREVFLLTSSLLDNADAFFELWLTELAKTAAEPDIAILMGWTETETKTWQLGRGGSATSRVGYLFFVLDRALAYYRAIVGGDRTLSHYYDLNRTRDHNLNRARDLVLALGHALAFNPDRVRALAFDLARVRAVTRAEIPQAFQNVQETAEALGLTRLQAELERLVIPDQLALEAEWRDFNDQLERVLRAYIPLQQVLLSTKQVERIIAYLETNLLLLDCLKLAYVSDREGIKNRMLLLPENDA